MPLEIRPIAATDAACLIAKRHALSATASLARLFAFSGSMPPRGPRVLGEAGPAVSFLQCQADG
jgi:hypothetical protein